MNRKRVSLAAAAAGTLAGVTGLAVLAVPAGAGPSPALPSISADQLVRSVLEVKSVPAMTGTVTGTNNLGLPSIPGLGKASALLANGSTTARVWADGNGRGRLSLPDGNSEETVVYDGKTVWDWESSAKTVKKFTAGTAGQEREEAVDPAATARKLVDLLDKSSVVRVDGTGTVAGRPVYQLVLTPKPTERTMLREVRVAVDSETRVPLRLSVTGNGSAQPALRIGFSNLTVGAQDPALFQFTPPAGAKVTTGEQRVPEQDSRAETAPADIEPTVVGNGWDTVFIARLPVGPMTNADPNAGRSGQDSDALLKQLGKPVSGAWGTGYAISTSVGTALITSDGRVAAGAVPLQVLTGALENSR
ncbi:MAG: outer membrane lipoprotein carrier protein LolA [Kutzneria sp.]|nr:outer membrane lipoprotein carrier protein LolA [Kutzneria sp.]